MTVKPEGWKRDNKRHWEAKVLGQASPSSKSKNPRYPKKVKSVKEMPADQKRMLSAIEQILVNDEASSDAELREHFKLEFGLTSKEADYYISQRDEALKDGLNFKLNPFVCNHPPTALYSWLPDNSIRDSRGRKVPVVTCKDCGNVLTGGAKTHYQETGRIPFYSNEFNLDEAKVEVARIENKIKKENDSGYPDKDLLRRYNFDKNYLQSEIESAEK
jgi:hypothetical protein